MASKSLKESDSFNMEALNMHIPTSEVEIAVSARDLSVSESDLVACALRIKEFGQEKWRTPVWKTESIRGQNPRFAEKYRAQYFFEERQHLQFEIYVTDVYNELNKLVGFIDVTLGSLVNCMTTQEDLVTKNGTVSGQIIVKAEELEACKKEVTLQWKAENLCIPDGNGPPAAYLEIAREDIDTNDFTVVLRSDQAPVSDGMVSWSPPSISLQTLCNGDSDRSLKITCWNQNQCLLGEFMTTLNDLEDTPDGSKDFKLQDTTGVTIGKIVLVSCKPGFQYTFLDHIFGGMQIALTVAVDFTRSNGNPTEPNSLHYLGNLETNPYATALCATLNILEDYDSDKRIPTFGFGGIPKGQDTVSHMFPLNGNHANPCCYKVQEVLDAYKLAVQSSTLHGPTYFAPIINHVSKQAQQTLDGTQYNILMIITDGNMNDMPATKLAIIKASKLPVSIIIVGVGDEDFRAMHILDGDVTPIKWKNEVAVRDIVQFTEFRDVAKSPEALAKCLMEEVPGQVSTYMKYRQITPKPRRNSISV